MAGGGGAERLYGSFFPSTAAWAPAEAPAPRAPSWDCGGTAHLLPEERRRASFSVKDMTLAIDGGQKATAHKWFLWRPTEQHDNSANYFQDRDESLGQHVSRFISIHRQFAEKGYQPKTSEIPLMQAASRNSGAMALHFGAFAPTLAKQMTGGQLMEWLRPAYTMRIIGCLAQTELSHGSNVRALQTTAHYDQAAEEFVLNTPTLGSMKWWPGGLGKTATHAALYAQLYVGGKCYGVHTFMLQLRDENHRPLPGIELGEVGPKIGDNYTDTGYMRLRNVRIPRKWLMMKSQEVTKDGRYVPAKKDGGGGKSQYFTMLLIRAGLVMAAGYKLAQGVTISVRYSCVRTQGFVDTAGTDHTAPERKVLDYQNQQLRLFRQLAAAYTMLFTGKNMSARLEAAMGGGATAIGGGGDDVDPEDLSEMVAMSAGLKAVCTMATADGLEECRKCCGGHGVLLSGGVAALARDYLPMVTAEGDRIVLELTSAKYLMKALAAARAGGRLAKSCEYLAPLRDGRDPAALPPHAAAEEGAFCDPGALVGIFRHRALVAVHRAGSRLDAARRRGGSDDDALNDCAIDLVDASRAHCALVCLQNFAEAAGKAEGPGVRPALQRLCALHGALQVQDASGDWAGYLTPQHTAAARGAVRRLLRELRPDAVALVDAFEFPDNVLMSALGRHDGNVYEALYASARASPLNAADPFRGYDAHLRPWLDRKFIAKNAKKVRSDPPARL